MLSEQKTREVKKLLSSDINFDIKLIAFEYDTTVSEILNIKSEMEREKKQLKAKRDESKSSTVKSSETDLKKRRTDDFSNIKLLRERYKKLTESRDTTPKSNNYRKQNEKQKKYIEFLITEIEKTIERIKTSTKLEKNKETKVILNEIRKVLSFNCDLTEDQAFKLWQLLSNEVFRGIALSNDDSINVNMSRIKRHISKALSDAIKVEFEQAETLKDYERLSKYIVPKIIEEDYVNFSVINDKIRRKILEFQRSGIVQKKEKERNDAIAAIITDIIDKKDPETINNAINSLAQKWVDTGSKGKDALSFADQRNRVINKIGRMLETDSQKFEIEDLEGTIDLIQKVTQGNGSDAINFVVKYLIGRNEITKARNLFNKLCEQDNKVRKDIYPLEYIIYNAEITQTVLTLLNSEKIGDNELNLYNILKRGAQRKGINLKSIIIGKKGNGLGKVTLADIWDKVPEK